MLKQVDENANTIYGDLGAQRNLKYQFNGKNNILFFARNSTNVNVTFRGHNALVFIANNARINGAIEMASEGVFI